MNKSLPKMALLFLLLGSVLQVTWYGLLWSSMVSQMTLLTGADFSILYTGGRIAATDYSMVYDIETQRRVQSELLGRPLPTDELLPFNHPPLLLPILGLLSALDYRTAYLLWDLLMILCLAGAAYLLTNLLRSRNWEGGAIAALLLSGALFYPIFIGLLKGQDTPFLMLGATVLMLGLVTEKDYLCGIGLAMLVVRPQFALMLGLPFLLKRRRVLGWALLAGLVPLATLLPLGVDGLGRFINLVLVTAHGQGFYINQSAMFNLLGILVRSLPATLAPAIPAITWIGFGLAFVLVCAGWVLAGDEPLKYFGAALLLSMFFSPHLHYHDLSPLALAAIAAALIWVDKKLMAPSSAGVLLMACSIYLLVMDVLTPIRFAGVYLAMIFLGIAIWRPEIIGRILQRARGFAHHEEPID